MIQANSLPIRFAPRATFSFEIVFEELPLFRLGDMRGGMIDGRAEVTYDHVSEDWSFTDIAICTDNRRMGTEARGQMIGINIEDHPHLYQALLDRLTEDYASNIEERIVDSLAWAA